VPDEDDCVEPVSCGGGEDASSDQLHCCPAGQDWSDGLGSCSGTIVCPSRYVEHGGQCITDAAYARIQKAERQKQMDKWLQVVGSDDRRPTGTWAVGFDGPDEWKLGYRHQDGDSLFRFGVYTGFTMRHPRRYTWSVIPAVEFTPRIGDGVFVRLGGGGDLGFAQYLTEGDAAFEGSNNFLVAGLLQGQVGYYRFLGPVYLELRYTAQNRWNVTIGEDNATYRAVLSGLGASFGLVVD